VPFDLVIKIEEKFNMYNLTKYKE